MRSAVDGKLARRVWQKESMVSVRHFERYQGEEVYVVRWCC
jgi:hypothetical protein